MNVDTQIRVAAFDWLNDQCKLYGEVLPYSLLKDGFNFNGEKVHLVGQTGIWKPRQCSVPISILTSVKSMYDDGPEGADFINYSYRGTNPAHHDNVGLRKVMSQGLPLIYFLGVSRGKYMPIYPVYIVKDDPANLRIVMQADSQSTILAKLENEVGADPVRKYVTREVKYRIHGGIFRESVIAAYGCQCTLCRIKHEPLLDAAHIIPDNHELGIPSVNNGLALCKIHHAAYDANLMGITPDYTIKVKHDLLEEFDGPMLQHGIKELHDKSIVLPRHKLNYPSPDNLDFRFQKFLKAG
jgi:putative restriction endonuclease